MYRSHFSNLAYTTSTGGVKIHQTRERQKIKCSTRRLVRHGLGLVSRNRHLPKGCLDRLPTMATSTKSYAALPSSSNYFKRILLHSAVHFFSINDIQSPSELEGRRRRCETVRPFCFLSQLCQLYDQMLIVRISSHSLLML